MLAEEAGFESACSSSPKSHNIQTKIPQNSAESNTSGGEATAPDDKFLTTPEQEKDTLLHEKCALSVHQNFLPLAREPELIIKAWTELDEEVKQKILKMISKEV